MKNRLGGLAFFRKNFQLVLSVDGICICIASRTRQITTFSAWPYLVNEAFFESFASRLKPNSCKYREMALIVWNGNS